ncbi:MAG TPA: ethanolamine utilization protein EutN [Armatimonadetes bacterium]|nr:ethanolamine utilization protein EutN [Armatimonadota bacterium]
MNIARVIGKVWATIKDEKYVGIRLRVIEPIDEHLRPTGEPFIAADGVGVGEGEIVFYETAREAPMAMPDPETAVDASIVGIVDRVDLRPRFQREEPK